MQAESNILALTSINPYSNLDYQRLCFERWKSIGVKVVTCNTRAEAEVLIKRGVSETDIRHVRDDRSGQALFGKPVPLIRPLLAELEDERDFEHFFLTNSDIYPAVRSSSVARYWADSSEALALTREETHDLSSHAFDVESPYRGGLDVFFFQRPGLKKLNRILDQTAAADRMAFGVPGWDYLIGACLLSSEMDGEITDSHVLLHQSHKPTYGNMNEFGWYVPDMQRLGVATGTEPAVAAAEFAALIEQQCDQNYNRSRLTRILFYDPSRRGTAPEADDAALTRCWNRLMDLAPALESCYRRRPVTSLLQRMSTDPGAGLDTALSFLLNSKSILFQFNQALFGIVLVLMARDEPERTAFTENYPAGNQHAAALRNILDRHNENDPLRRLWIARLFGSELVDHGIFNPRLYQYLVLACDNDCELKLVQEIELMTRTRHHAA